MASQWTGHAGRVQRRRSPGLATGFVVVGVPKQELRRAWKWLVATGILALLAGVAAIVVPAAASVAIAIFIGWILTFAGIVMGLDAWRHPATRTPARIVNAALTLLVGLYLLIFPLSGTVTLTLLLAIWFFGAGALELLAAWRVPVLLARGFMVLSGALSVILGILIVADLPSSADWAIGLLVGINLLFWGVRALIVSALLKRAIERP